MNVCVFGRVFGCRVFVFLFVLVCVLRWLRVCLLISGCLLACILVVRSCVFVCLIAWTVVRFGRLLVRVSSFGVARL